MTQPSEGHAVPRLHKLGYLEVVLGEVAEKASFERIRQALLRFAEHTGEQRMVRGVISRLRDEYTFWSPTQEALSELMRLGFVTQAPVPSGRRYVDAHRASTYELTPQGYLAIEQLRKGGPRARADFLDMLAVALTEAHLGFADLLNAANQHPLCIPEYTIEKISSLVEGGAGNQRLAEDGISLMSRHWPDGLEKPTPDSLAAWTRSALERRFPRDRVRQPSQKDVLDTTDDAVLGFVAKARKIRLDAISFNVCMSWASQLAVLAESRYVEDWPGRTIWATATINDHAIQRRGFREAGPEVRDELKKGFELVADRVSGARTFGYLPIYRVRAQAAFASRVNLRLVDRIMGQVMSGEVDAPYRLQVALGRGTPPPRSEPIFTHEGRRFFDMQITEKEV